MIFFLIWFLNYFLIIQDKGIPATFQIIYLVGWKPCETQPKPMERGSADVSLKDLENVMLGSEKYKRVK